MSLGLEDRLLKGDVQRRDPSVFGQIVELYSPKLMGIAYRILKSQSDAEDAVQDALISAWKSFEQFDGKSSLATWLHRITVNASLAVLKKKSRVQMNTVSLMDHDLPQTDKEHEANELREVVWQAVDRLPDPYRVVLVLCDVEGMSHEDVAAELSLSSVAVRKRLSRARAKVALSLAPELATQSSMFCGGTPFLLWQFLEGTLESNLVIPITEHVESCPNCNSIATYGVLEAERDVPKTWYSLETWTSKGLLL